MEASESKVLRQPRRSGPEDANLIYKAFIRACRKYGHLEIKPVKGCVGFIMVAFSNEGTMTHSLGIVSFGKAADACLNAWMKAYEEYKKVKEAHPVWP
jgi:hypothetical protein